MLGHEIFDSELGRRVLVDHALIVIKYAEVGDLRTQPFDIFLQIGVFDS